MKNDREELLQKLRACQAMLASIKNNDVWTARDIDRLLEALDLPDESYKED